MKQDDPLDEWLYLTGLERDSEVATRMQAEAHAALNRLTDLLDKPPPPPKKIDMYGIGLWGWQFVVASAPSDLALARELYQRVYVTGGQGSMHVQEGLLNLIATSADPVSVPFWLEILELSRPRDQFAKRRRTMALAALALLASRRAEAAGFDALRKIATQHTRPDVRALAVYYLSRVYQESERPASPEALTDVASIALQDRAFLPRFQARAFLRAADQALPMDNPGGVYAFKVKFMWDKRIYRTIELRAEQTLENLHFAIQRAVGWDADHLYSFYMNGELYDRRYAFACPYEDDNPPWADEAIVGELGLVKKHKFLYYFDYGDSHKFEVQVVGIEPQAEPGEYPRVVASQGEAPPQYHW